MENVRFVARQAILDREEKVFAYELLYRNSEDNFFPSNVSDDNATVRLFFDSILFFGLDRLINDKKAFINLSTNTVLSELPKLMPPKNIVFEIIERAEKLNNVLTVVEKLQTSGYVFALDDYDGQDKWEPLLNKVKFIKFEVDDDIDGLINNIIKLKLNYPNKKVIVERIEDYNTFEKLKAAGTDYFQGFYFTKPQVLNFKNIDSSKLIAIELLKTVMAKPLDFQLLINRIKNDAGIVSRILRLSNAACKTSKHKISSISQAVVYLGEDTIKRFITMLTLGEIGNHKPSELLKLGLIRAQFIKLLLQNKKIEIIDAGYLVGLISILAALLDTEASVIYSELPLSEEILNALEKHQGILGELLSLCIKFEQVVVYNRSTMNYIENIKNELELSDFIIMKHYAESLFYADEMLGYISE